MPKDCNELMKFCLTRVWVGILISQYVYSAGSTISGCPDDLLGSHSFTSKGCSEQLTFCITRGDYSPLMALCIIQVVQLVVVLMICWAPILSHLKVVVNS